ncbi:MAG: ABC transporter permease [Pseudomonadota bacterium]
MATLMRYLGLTGFFGTVFLRKLMQYRVDFLLGATGFLVSVLTRTLFLVLVFRQVDQIAGWSFHEILFLFGFSLLPRGLDHLFCDQLWELGRKLVQQGDFYKVLIRPVNPLFQLLSERFFYPDGLGEIVAGLALMLYALQQMDHLLSALQWALLPLLVLCGAVIYTAIKLAFATLAFWTVNSLPVMNTAYQLSSFVKYPIDIFHQAVRFVLTWCVPFAFTAYMPVLYLLRGDTSMLPWTPLVAVLAFLAAYRFWLVGLDHYETTGS